MSLDFFLLFLDKKTHYPSDIRTDSSKKRITDICTDIRKKKTTDSGYPLKLEKALSGGRISVKTDIRPNPRNDTNDLNMKESDIPVISVNMLPLSDSI